jgi:phospholipid/cholesterol/gamma-HCH transport system permease protein
LLQQKLTFDAQGLPSGIQGLLKLATAVPPREGARRPEEKQPFLARIGDAALRVKDEAADILSFVGAIQLLMFGAQIYVANLVAVAMVRVMGAVMAAVIMAGRTGAAFAAQLGTMQVNEEIDALKTLGISPMEFLVLPRMLALVIMMPILCVYADPMGILGGLIVGVGMLNLGLIEYLNQTQASLSLSYFWIGLFYGAVFGVLIALSGCLRGMQCGRSASAVG